MLYQLQAEATDTVTEAFAHDFARRFIEGWNSHDPDRLLSLATEDVLWEDPYILPDGRAQGHDAVRTWLHSVWRAFPDLTFSALDATPDDLTPGIYISGDRKRVVAPWRGTGRMRGPLEPPGFAPAGGRVEQFGVDIWAFRGDRVCHVRTFTDVLSVAMQIGAAPRPGTLMDRLGVQMQRITARRLRRRAN